MMYETILHILSLNIDFQIKAFVIEYFTIMKQEFLSGVIQMRDFGERGFQGDFSS